MAQPTGQIAVLKQRLIAELKRDKRRAVVLGVLFVVAAVVVGSRLIGGFWPSEVRRARAAADLVAPSSDPLPTATVAHGPEPADAHEHSAYVTQLDRTIRRDIFRLDLALFPAAGTEKSPDGTVTPADAGQDAAKKEQAVRDAAAALALQSTIVGNRPTAVINGEVAAVGSTVGGFRVVAIGRRSCDLEKDGVRVKLLMKE